MEESTDSEDADASLRMGEGMRKEQTKRETTFRFMLVVNIVLAATVVLFFWGYVRIDRKTKIEEALHVAQDKTSTLAQNFGSYLFSLDMVGRSYITYIEDTDLSREETIEYLRNWRNFYAQIDLVEVETLRAECLYADSARDKEEDFSDKAWVTELCGKFDVLERDGLLISVTEPFLDDETGQAMIAFYRPMYVRGERYLLMFLSKLDDLQLGGMNVQGLDLDRGLLIDGKGNILMGQPEGITEQDGGNYYSFAENHSGEARREEFHRLHREQAAGHYTVTDASGEEWMCIFHTVPMTEGWLYLYHVNVNEMLREADTVTLAFCMTLFMGAWLLLDIIVYFRFNRRLQKSLVIIEQKNEELAFASRAKTAFVSNISHEIRTPINAVLGMDEMILRECRDDTIRAYAVDIQKAGKVLLGLINDVLDFTKIESGKVEIVPVEYDAASVIHDVCNLIEIRAKAKYLALEVQVAPDLPVRLFGDEVRLKQIVINLLNNAVKYTEKGTVTFSVACEKASAEEAVVAVSVKDTGIGIKPEDLGGLFDEYKRVDELRNRAVEGTGLGLPIVRRLLEKMGSRLEVESEYGRGSVFSFQLKQHVVDWTPMGDFQEARRRLTEQAEEDGTTEFRASHARLLAVDDNQVNLTVVKGLLKRTGIQIDTARSGEECLRLAEQNKYDLILLDHRMPEMDGIETLHRIRGAEGPNRDAPIIALTANVVSGAKEMYIGEGFSDFLSKPLNAGSLERTILKYLPEERLDRTPADGKGASGAGSRDASETVADAGKTSGAETESGDASEAKAGAGKTDGSGEDDRGTDATGTNGREAARAKAGAGKKGGAGKDGREAHGKGSDAADHAAFSEDEALHQELLRDFVEEYPETAEAIRTYLEAGDVKNYTVVVHGLKSSARYVGAALLSEEARCLEEYGKAEDRKAMEENTGKFLEHYRAIVRNIKRTL